MSVRIGLGLGDLQKDLIAIGAAGPRILARALDRAATGGKTAMARAISKDIGIANKTVTRQIRIDKAGLSSKTDPRIVVSISGRPIPLIAFGARGPEPSRGKGRGVRTKLPAKRHLPHAFIATMPGGHRGVYQREGKGRLPIKQEFGPAMPDVFEKFIPTVFEPAAQESLTKNVIHELEFELSKQGGA